LSFLIVLTTHVVQDRVQLPVDFQT